MARRTVCLGIIHVLIDAFPHPRQTSFGLVGDIAAVAAHALWPQDQVRLEQVSHQYFDLHPDFAPMGCNACNVNNLIAAHVRGNVSHELYRLIGTIGEYPLHQQVMR